MFRNLLVQFWSDESGAVIAIEYLLLGTVVAAGGVTGMTAVRDSVTDEYREMGNTVREVRQQATMPAAKGGSGTTGASAASNTAVQGNPLATPAVPTAVPQVTFACP